MSEGPIPQEFLGVTEAIPPEDVKKILQQPVLGAPTGTIWDTLNCPPPEKLKPKKQLPGPTEMSADAEKTTIQAFINEGYPCWLAVLFGRIMGLLVFAFAVLTGMTLWAFETFGIRLLPIGLNMIDKFRRDIDAPVAKVSALVLNELLGTDFTAKHMPIGDTVEDHIARAGQIGKLFHQQMLENFTADEWKTGAVGRGGAERLTGQIVNFGVATALLGLAGEVGSGGLFKDFRLIGEQVTSGLGLGRLNRFAMKPLVKTTVELPYTWWLNKTFRPTQFKPAEVINPFTAQLMPTEQIYNAMALAGYSDDKTQALIELHQKRLTLDDVEILKRWGYWSEDVVHKYLVKLGWPEELADTAGRIPELKRIDARISKFIDKLETEVDDGRMTADDALAIIKTLPVTEDERAVIQATMIAHTKVPHRSLTLTEIEKAFESGLITVDDVVGRLQQLGFQGDDLSVLTELVLLKFAHDQEAKDAAAARVAARERKAKAKGTPAPKRPPIVATPPTP
jgi:hypothetical protein